jgi:hypothetical protein
VLHKKEFFYQVKEGLGEWKFDAEKYKLKRPSKENRSSFKTESVAGLSSRKSALSNSSNFEIHGMDSNEKKISSNANATPLPLLDHQYLKVKVSGGLVKKMPPMKDVTNLASQPMKRKLFDDNDEAENNNKADKENIVAKVANELVKKDSVSHHVSADQIKSKIDEIKKLRLSNV